MMGLLAEGETILNTYEVETFLGEGSFAEVYRVKHRFLGRQAMKVFKATGLTVSELDELLMEAKLLSRLGHQNIIRVFDANVTETPRGLCGFFTMEYLAGGSLERFWQSHNTQFVPVETVIDIMIQVCKGLSIAHSETPSIIHRDIKPQNILLGYDGDGLRARIADFGLAKQVNPTSMQVSGRGTLAFKAPEVLIGNHGDSCKSDVWSVGATMYLLLTDRLPGPELTDSARSSNATQPQDIPRPSRFNINVDERLNQITLRALAYDPIERYGDATELLMELQRWSEDSTKEMTKQPNALTSDWKKSALGLNAPPDARKAEEIAEAALKLAAQSGSLVEAADLMEEALSKAPSLRARYGSRIQLWRRGIAM